MLTQPTVKWVPSLSPGVNCGRGVRLTTHPPSSAVVMEQYSYTSTHPLGHTGPVTGSLYLYYYYYYYYYYYCENYPKV